MTPEWGTQVSELPTETQFLLLEHGSKGPYSILLPLIDGKFRATLKADRDRCVSRTGISLFAHALPLSQGPGHLHRIKNQIACTTNTPAQQNEHERQHRFTLPVVSMVQPPRLGHLHLGTAADRQKSNSAL
jgi:hypothetical protein